MAGRASALGRGHGGAPEEQPAGARQLSSSASQD